MIHFQVSKYREIVLNLHWSFKVWLALALIEAGLIFVLHHIHPSSFLLILTAPALLLYVALQLVLILWLFIRAVIYLATAGRYFIEKKLSSALSYLINAISGVFIAFSIFFLFPIEPFMCSAIGTSNGVKLLKPCYLPPNWLLEIILGISFLGFVYSLCLLRKQNASN